MPGKVRFGADYLFIMRDLQLRSSEDLSLDLVSDAACRLFLFYWGLNVEEIDEANKEFFNKMENHGLEDLQVVFERISSHLKNDSKKIEQFITEYAAIASMDFNVTDEEAALIPIFKNEFDLRQSELEAYTKRGFELAMIFAYLGEKYTGE